MTPLTNVGMGDMVVARFFEDGQLYRVKVISIKNMLYKVLFIDFGEIELQPVDTSMELPAQFRYLKPLAGGVEGMINNEDCREMVDKLLDGHLHDAL